MEFIILFVLAIIVAIILNIRKRNIEKGILEAGEEFTKKLEDTGFKIDTKIKILDNVLYVDNKNKKWVIKEGITSEHEVFGVIKTDREEYPLQIFSFSDLIEFELYERNDNVIQARSVAAPFGKALLGNVETPVSKKICRTLQLKIRVNDRERPERVLKFIELETEADSELYINIMKECKEMTKALSCIKKDSKK